MKTIPFLAGVILLLVIHSCHSEKKVSDNSEQLLREFQARTDRWRDAYNSGNAQNLLPLYDLNADYVSGHVAGLEALGREKLIANFQNGMNMGGHIDEVKILKMEISCDLATLYCKYTATNSGVTVQGRNLLILRKVNNDWLIVIHMTVI